MHSCTVRFGVRAIGERKAGQSPSTDLNGFSGPQHASPEDTLAQGSGSSHVVSSLDTSRSRWQEGSSACSHRLFFAWMIMFYSPGVICVSSPCTMQSTPPTSRCRAAAVRLETQYDTTGSAGCMHAHQDTRACQLHRMARMHCPRGSQKLRKSEYLQAWCTVQRLTGRAVYMVGNPTGATIS